MFCGIDIGTTNTKAVLLDSDGRVLDRAVLGQPVRGDVHRIDPQVWFGIKFWVIKTGIIAILGSITVIWFVFGGLSDLRYFFKVLKLAKQNVADDGRVAERGDPQQEATEKTTESV